MNVQKIIVDIIDSTIIKIGASFPFKIFPKIIRNENITNIAITIDFKINLTNNNSPIFHRTFGKLYHLIPYI